VQSLRLNRDIRTQQADKGNCTVVLDESKYNKLNTLLESGVYEPLPTAKIERQEWKLLSKNKTFLTSDLKNKLIPYLCKPPHLYGLCKIHKPDICLRHVSSVSSLCNAVAVFLHKILSPLCWKVRIFCYEFRPLRIAAEIC
jgi:hypothetical protein